MLFIGWVALSWVRAELQPKHENLLSRATANASDIVAAFQNNRLEKTRRQLKRRQRIEFWVTEKTNGSQPVGLPPEKILRQIKQLPAVVHPFQNTAGRFFIFAIPVERKGKHYEVYLSSHKPLRSKRPVPPFWGGNLFNLGWAICR